MRTISEAEVRCEIYDAMHITHVGPLRDYASPGSLTEIQWMDDDRRTFRGEFVECPEDCKLPANHRGDHVSPNA